MENPGRDEGGSFSTSAFMSLRLVSVSVNGRTHKPLRETPHGADGWGRCAAGGLTLAVPLALLIWTTLFAGLMAGPAGAAPDPSPARTGPPNSVALLGDSISAGTGTSGLPGAEQPANSWGTGTNSSIQSIYQRLLAINPSISGNNYNQATNGERMTHMAAQASSMPTDTQYVLVQLGGNDLCKDSLAQMTPIATYRSQFVAGLEAIATRAPNALIHVSSIPDIFNLWFLRGAPNPPNDQPSSRAGTARFFWDTLSVIPCQSLVDNPTDMSAAAVDRRQQVRQRTIDLNEVLAEECAKVLRCRFDENATFNFSSNRTDPLSDSPYLPRAEWEFVDDDISTIDHFHPSSSGQTKLARVAWEAGRDFTDGSAPSHSATTVSPAPLANGTSLVPPTVTSAWSDASGVRGVEFRLHTGAGPGPWDFEPGESVAFSVTTVGPAWLETRALDSNGNMSGSRITEVNYDPTAVPEPLITATPPAWLNSNSASVAFAVDAGLESECSLDGQPFAACTSPVGLSGLSEAAHEFRVRQVGPTGIRGEAATASWNVDTTAPSAPTLSGGPPPRTNSTSATITASGEPLATLSCSLDGGPFTACASPISLSGLVEGSHSLSVRQADRAGNLSAPSVLSWEVDTTAPAPPVLSGAPETFTNSTNAVISLTGEPGGSFRCSIDGSPFSACSSPVVRTGLSDGNRSVSVNQTDAAGNTGTPASVSWTVDTVAPAAPSLSGAPVGTTSSTGATLSFSGEVAASFECSLDAAAFAPCLSPLVLSELPDGLRAFAVRQKDRAGNTSPATNASWTVDSPPSPPALTAMPVPLSNQRSASVSFSGRPGAVFSCSLDSAAFEPCTSPVSLAGLGDGPHSFAVRQTSGAGSQSAPASFEWTIDATAPAAPVFEQPPAPAIAARTVIARFNGEPGGSFECRIDDAQWQPCTSPVPMTGLSEGPHSFETRQSDLAGNVGQPTRLDWIVDTVKPGTPTVSGAGPGRLRSTNASLTLTGEPGLDFECRLNGSPWSACSSPLELSKLGQGRQALEVRQTDRAGNTSEAGTATWTVDTVAPRLTGRVKAIRRGKKTTLKTRFQRTAGKPSKLEYSTSRKKPANAARAVPKKTTRWAPKLKLKSRPKITWARVSDSIGNTSPWYRVR